MYSTQLLDMSQTAVTPYNQSNNQIFNPKQISGCSLWLDATDSSTISTTGNSVTQWRDKSGNTGRDATAVSNPQLSAINGVQAMNMTTASYFTGAVSITTTTLTCFAVANTTRTLPNAGVDQRLVSLANTTNADFGRVDGTIALFNQGSSSGIAVWRTPGLIGLTPITTNTPFMAVSQYTGTNGFIWGNGTAGSTTGTASSGSFAITKYGIGNQANPTAEYWVGTIGEVILYNTSLTTAQRQQVEGYLAWKWGTQRSLPTTHPYYNNAYLANSYPISYFPPRLTPTSVVPTVPGFTIPTTIRQYVFNPRSITGAALWLDAADANTVLRTGSTVTQWNDKSGNGNNAIQLTASNMPTYLNIPAISQNAIYFPSNSTNLTTIKNNSTTGNSSRTIFVITYLPNSSSILRIGTGTHATNTPPSAFGIDQSPPTTRLFAPYVYTGSDNVLSVSLTGIQCIYAYYDSSVSQIGGGYGFTTFTTKNTTLNTTATPWYFGLRPDNSGSATSYVCEVIQYNNILTTAQRQQVEGYLAWKWGLQSNLPANHPFKLFPP